jgi:predicted nucleic acid-binding protein
MIEELVLVDTGALIALYNLNDPAHDICSDLVRELPLGKVYTCWPVITEAAYLLRKYARQRNAFFEAVSAGEFQLLPLDGDDLREMRNVFAAYADQTVDLTDAALVHLGNREQISSVFTTDRRHFRIYRLKNGRYFRILPTDH